MSKCKLDINDPKFVASISPISDALHQGLNELREKVAKDHMLSGWFNQQIHKKYAQYQGRVWKWDFAPEGDRSSTRPGWRLYAYVPNLKAPEPIPAIPFLCYEKPGPDGDFRKIIGEALAKFLTTQIINCESEFDEDSFSRTVEPDGRIVLVCRSCFRVQFVPTCEDENAFKTKHLGECPGTPTGELAKSPE